MSEAADAPGARSVLAAVNNSSSASASASASSSASHTGSGSVSDKPVKGVWKPRDPNLDHLHSDSFEHVYEPAEDSFLLMDALHKDLIIQQRLHQMRRACIRRGSADCDKDCASGRGRCSRWLTCLELGPGSGVIITHLSRLLRHRGRFLALDVNPRACVMTEETLRRNGATRAEIIQGELVQPIKEKMRGTIDILVFNPPYVPTPPEEMQGDGISRSWAGGEKGREVLDRLLPDVQHLLSARGVFYCVLLSVNEPDEVAAILKEHGGFEAELILQRRAGREDLQIVRYSRPMPTATHSSVPGDAAPQATNDATCGTAER